MILRALHDYYQRLMEDPDQGVSPPGFSEAKIGFALILDRGGKLLEVHDLREQKGKRLLPRLVRAPQAVKRSVNISPNFLWDNTGYVLGADGKGNSARSAQAFQSFKELAHQLGDDLEDDGVRAVLAFLDAWDPDDAANLDLWEEMASQNLVFRLDGQRGFAHESRASQKAWLLHWTQEEAGEVGQCLVTGQRKPLARLHPAIKGVLGAQSSGANLVSFNLDAFTSYGKQQSYNAPVSAEAAFAYTTVLNRLLAPDSRQKIRIGDATVVFWSRDDSPLEELFGLALGGAKADDQGLNQRLREFLEAARQGVPFPGLDPANPFYILGLSPNASRISVRFWHVSTVGDIQRRLGEHLRDLEIARQSEQQIRYPPAWMLLKETAAQGKSENVPPLLGGELTRAILGGGSYPRLLLTAVTGRIRADKQVSYLRAALIKAYLGRRYRLNQAFRKDPKNMEVSVSLDMENVNPAYRLGRLFAVLEDLQRAALPGIKSTIRDKYLSSASSAPRASFPYLLRNAQNHYNNLRKQEGKGGLAVFFDKLMSDITGGIDARAGFPANLNMEQQGLFFLGYYHQKAYRPAKDETDATSANDAAETRED